MATAKNRKESKPKNGRFWHAATKYIPILEWGTQYHRSWLTGDLLAGLIVAIMLVPQGMAYALLAGLPPQVGLYASIIPLLIYGVLGASRVLAVGPVAIVSLLVASGVSQLAESGTAVYWELALTLALMVGVIQALMGLLRVGFLVNFLSHPVLSGFTSAAAIVIGFSQIKHLLGLNTPRMSFFESVQYTVLNMANILPITFAIGLGAIGFLLYFKYMFSKHLRWWGVPPVWVTPLAKSGPLVVVLGGTLLVWFLGLDEVVKVVGAVPQGWPPITIPSTDIAVWRALLPTALAISFVGFTQSLSVSRALASKKRQKVYANQELIALGAANLGAAFTGGYPVTGGFSRSVVNYEAGANTGLASIVTAVLLGIVVLFLTPLFHFLPQAVLAAIILVAVIGLIDIETFVHVWRYSKADGVSLLVTFMAVLALGVEDGILVGVAVAMVLYIWRTSRPHVAVVGHLHGETYRNVLRHPVQTCDKVVAIRIDESLFFANTAFLEDTVLQLVADNLEIDHFVLSGAAINFIDASALETLESLHHELHDAGVVFHLSDIKGPVMDRLQKVGVVALFGEENIHLTLHDAMCAIGCRQPMFINETA